MEEEILFSKYYVQNVLKKSEKTRVLLADYDGSRRIVKEILKDDEGYESLQWETAILQTLDFPGIPKLYEVLETETHAYLVEEYIEGQTLQEIIAGRGAFDLAETIFYGRKLADIVNYLHSKKPNAVLHLDIQPKNIIIQGESLYLIDYGNAAYAQHFDEKQFLKGTRGYAAPEQYRGEHVSVQTDVFGIGACMAYMITGAIPGTKGIRMPESIRNFISGCIAEKPSDRFQSVEMLIEELRYLEMSMLPSIAAKKYRKDNRRRNMENPIVISFVGAQPRIGTSVMAMGFTEYLQHRGLDVLYEENNPSEMVSRIVKEDAEVNYANGEFYYHGIPMRPYYASRNVKLNQKRRWIIRDEGTYDCNKHYSSWMVLIAGIQSWEKVYTEAVIRDLRVKAAEEEKQIVWIWNFTGGQGEEKYMASLGVAGIRIPYMNQDNQRIFEAAYEKIWKRLDCEFMEE